MVTDGSPTPRKAASHFGLVEDARIDASPEILGAVGSRRPKPQATAPAHYWPFSLTSQLQGVKRPLTRSTRGNQQIPPEQLPAKPDSMVLDGYKVRVLYHSTTVQF